MNTETDFDPWADLEKEEPARTPRSLETREKTERRTSYKPPSLLPDPDPQDGYTFRWVRHSSRGVEDKTNFNMRLRGGWEPVRAEDYPEILGEWAGAPKTGLVEHGGLILCKMPQEMADQRNAYYYERSIAGLNSAEEHYMRYNDQIVKKFKDARARATFSDRGGRG